MEYLLTHAFETERQIPTLTLVAREGNPSGRVLVLHGLHSSKESTLGDLYQLARVGFIAKALDLRLHGEREDSGAREVLLDTDFAQGMQQIVYGTAEDVVYLMDHGKWDSLPMGLIGISAGGFVGHVLAMQEKRIQAMANIISSPDWLTIDPARTPPADSPAGQMLASLSPVNHPDAYPPLALSMMNGALDEVVRPSGSALLEGRLRPLYKARGIDERLRLDHYADLGHVYLSEMQDEAVRWMQRFLV